MLLLALLACSTPTPPDVLVVTLDTTRADALGAYGASPSPSPSFDALASRGMLVPEAMTTAPLTLPAHTSLMTGRWPDATGVRANAGRVPGDVVTLAERLGARGYRTGAFVGAVVLDRRFGLDQGFDVYDGDFDLTGEVRAGDAVPRRPAAETVDHALQWLAGVPGGVPWLCWVHLYDAHQPADYVAGLRSDDDALGRLLAAVDPDRTVVVVVGDHGEGRGDHGEAEHGLFVYRSTMRVPLVVAGPGVPTSPTSSGSRSSGSTSSGSTSSGARSIVDVLPTVLQLVGAPVDDVDGTSLLEPSDRPVYGESFYGSDAYGFAELRTIEDGRWHFVLAPRPELYDWTTDPAETTDLSASQADVVATERARMEAMFSGRTSASGATSSGATSSAATSSGAPTSADKGTTGDAATRAALASLGYADGLAIPADVRPDPKDGADVPRELAEAIVAARTRPPAEGAVVLQAFVDRHPSVGAARLLLAKALELAGRPADALAALDPLLAAHPDDPMLLVREGELAGAAGDDVRAGRALDRAVAIDPGDPDARAALAERARRKGDCDEALWQVSTGLQAAPTSSRLRVVRGACRVQQGDVAGLADLEDVLARHPDDVDARFLYGVSLGRVGRSEDALKALQAVLSARPGDVLAEAALGGVYYAQGRCDAAEPHLAAAAGDPRTGDETPALLADCALRRGDTRTAEQQLEVAFSRERDSKMGHRVRSALLMAQGDAAGAVKEMELAR